MWPKTWEPQRQSFVLFFTSRTECLLAYYKHSFSSIRSLCGLIHRGQTLARPIVFEKVSKEKKIINVLALRYSPCSWSFIYHVWVLDFSYHDVILRSWFWMCNLCEFLFAMLPLRDSMTMAWTEKPSSGIRAWFMMNWNLLHDKDLYGFMILVCPNFMNLYDYLFW